MKFVAVTACPTGIAHTYMAAEALQIAASEMDVTIKVETRGSVGAENELSAEDIKAADAVIMRRTPMFQKIDLKAKRSLKCPLQKL